MENRERETAGRVWLVGAGPGDAQLLTLKGRQVLAKADTVIYDALVGPGILGWIPASARQIYVGKRGGCHAMPQEEISELLLAQARAGRRVVRLKGGDPFVFGRGSEETALLRAHHIPFEIVPGVTSAVAVPAYCGIPVTHRGIATSFHVITGHMKNGEPVDLDFEALVRAGGTLIFLMGISNAALICKGLMSAGMPGETPAAFLQEGTTADQKKVISTLEHLVSDGEKAKIKAPAILMVGDVCALEADCRWAEALPLFGKRVLVTRPARRSGRMAELLREAGAEVVELPAIETGLLRDNPSLRTAVGNIRSYSWLAFTSPGGVEHFFEYLKLQKKDVRCLGDIKLAVIGRGTAAMLEAFGLYADYMPEQYYAGELGKGLSELLKPEDRLLILRAAEGSAELVRPLKEKNITYEDVALYETSCPAANPQTERVKELLYNGRFDMVTFTSASTVKGFMETMLPGKEQLKSFMAVCIGRETEKAAAEQGMSCVTAEIPTMESMIEVMKRMRD